MIRKKEILIALFLSSCSFIDYTALPSITKSIVFGTDDIKITRQFYNDQKYSFVKVKIGRHSIALFVLSKIDNNQFHWISSNGARLITLRDGRPVQLSSDNYNFKILPLLDYPEISDNETVYDYFISLRNPKAFINQAAILSKEGRVEIDYIDEKASVLLIKERVSSLSMRWKYENNFYVNNSGLGLRSELYFNPLAEKLELDFYYKL